MANKYLTNNAGQLTEREALDSSSGAGDAGKIPALDSSGRLAENMMPVGIGADTATVQASEGLSAGDFVNIHNVTDAARVRKADASTVGKEAHGFVLAAVTSGANATVYFEGSNTQVTGQVAGNVFLSADTPGAATATPPSGSGQIVQKLGVATSATSISTEFASSIALA